MRMRQGRRSAVKSSVCPGGGDDFATSQSVPVHHSAKAKPQPLLSRLSPDFFEPLEHRLHLSVARDANGFTVVRAPSDAFVYYVSSTVGNDANDGLSPSRPLRTIGFARTKLRNNSADQLLLRRGDEFTQTLTNWTLSGRSANEPIVIGAYTDPARPSTERPMILTGIGTGFANNVASSSRTPISNVYILGVGFEAHNRDYRQPNANFTINYREESAGATNGLNIIGPVSNFHVEDCSFQYFRHGMTIQSLGGWGNPANVTIRRSVITDNYARGFDATGKYITSEGIYAEGVRGLTLDENVFDHNGWTDPAFGDFGTFATIYNHNAYLNIGNDNVVVTGNIFANGASHGIQMRSGGIATNNLFINNPIAMSFGYVNGSEKAGGVSGRISGNVVFGSRDISGDARGWGIEIGNTRPGGGTIISNNIYTSFAAGGQPAIKLDYGVNNNNPAQAVGINDLTIQSNIVYGWTRGLYINPGFVPGGTGRQALNGLSVLNNEFQQISQTPVIIHGPAFTPTAETWRGNRYDLIGPSSSTTQFWTVRGSGRTLDQWRQLAEPTASTAEISYPNPSVSPQSYNASIGGANTLSAYLTEARRQSSTFWRTQYLATAAVNFMRAGFAGQRVDDLPPTASLSVGDISAGGAGTHTLQVNWFDDNQLNTNSIGNGDLLVTGPNGYSQVATLVSAQSNADGSAVSAIYSIPAAAGAWSAGANGVYDVSVRGNEVTDRAGNANPGGSIGSFRVNIAAAAPTATLAAVPTVTSPTAAATLSVTYNAGNGGLNVATLDDNDLFVTTASGFTVPARFVSVSPPGSGSPRVAIYSIDPPDGGWTEAANGTYEVKMNAGAVADVSGLSIGSATLGSFAVNVAIPRVVATAPNIALASSNAQTITVTYRDSSGINAATVDSADLTVEGPDGFQSPVTLITKTGAGTPANPLVATYRLNAPTGGWNPSVYNGTFYVILNENQVVNNAGSPAAAGPIGSFEVAIDIDAPAGVVTTDPVFKTTSATSLPIRIVYTDQTGVDINSVGTGNIGVNVPGVGTVTPTLVSKVGSGRSVTAVYSLPTPGGISSAVNGLWDIVLNEDSVADTLGNRVDGAITIGSVNVQIDSDPPDIYAEVSPFVDEQTPIDITLYYYDTPGVDESTIGAGDVRVSGPGGERTAEFLDVEVTDYGQVLAHYRLAPPTGGWQADNNGTYTVFVPPGAVADLSGNATTTRLDVGTFTVQVATTPVATMTAVTTQPGQPVDMVTVRFNQAVYGLSIEDLVLTRNTDPTNLLSGAEIAIDSDDGVTYTISGLAPFTTAGGVYTLRLVAADSGIFGEFGLPLTQDATVALSTDTAGPTVSAVAQPITVAGNQQARFTVTITDAVAVNANTLGNGDFIVRNDALGYSQIAQLISLDSFASGPVRVATYAVNPPTGGWSSAWNGTYAILARASQIADTSGNFTFTGAFAGSLTVNVSATGQADTTAPTATIAAVATPRSTAVDSLAITFSERVFNFDLADLSLTRDGGANLLTSAQTLSTTDGITYTLSNLTGLTTAVGSYSLQVQSTGTPPVADASGNVMSTSATRTWAVQNAVTPAPVISGISPNPVTASASAQNLTINGSNFTSTSVVRLRNVTTGSTILTPTVVSRTATQIVVSQVFGTTSSSWTAEVVNGSTSSGQVSFSVTPATALGISVGPNPVTGKTATVSAVNPGTNTTTRFTWAVTAVPSGAATPTFSVNNSNAAKVSTITFSRAGNYTLTLTSTTGTTVRTATMTVTVRQTLSSVVVTPSTASVVQGRTTQFSAVGKDQFGNNMSTQPTFTWSIDSGGAGGTVSATGLFTAPTNAVGSTKVRANFMGTSAVATVTVNPIRINFQLASAPTVSGYVVDSGNTYAARNGFTYGWTTSHTDAAVDRNKNSTQLLDTNVGMKSNARWEIALANGTYAVRLSVGDSSLATTNTVRLESTTSLSGVKLTANTFRTVTATVTVSDGRLTLTNVTAANLATRVNFIEITRI